MLARWWAVNDTLPQSAEWIIPVAHGATETRLTRGAEAVTQITFSLLTHYPHAFCAFGSFTGSPDPEVERLGKATLPRSSYLGPIVSTIEECLAFKKSLGDIEPGTIIVVTDQAHSRRCRIVWKTFFPKSDIRICAVSLRSTVDHDSPMTSYRKAWTAMLLQAAPTPFFWYLSLRGPEYMAKWATKIHQPVAK